MFCTKYVVLIRVSDWLKYFRLFLCNPRTKFYETGLETITFGLYRLGIFFVLADTSIHVANGTHARARCKTLVYSNRSANRI